VDTLATLCILVVGLNGGRFMFPASVVEEAVAMLDGPSNFARRLSKVSGMKVTRQAVYNWRMRGAFSKEVIPHVHRLTRISYEQLHAEPQSSGARKAKAIGERVPMPNFLGDPTHYLERARAGEVFLVTVNGKAVVQLGPAL
jgi:hypothetical protein